MATSSCGGSVGGDSVSIKEVRLNCGSHGRCILQDFSFF